MEALIKIMFVVGSALWFSVSVGDVLKGYPSFHMRQYVATHAGF